MKKIINIIIATMLLSTIFLAPNKSMALSSSHSDGGGVSVIDNPDYYRPAGDLTTVQGGNKLETMGNKIIGWVNYIATIISVLVLAVIGIKYMVGSVEEKASYKEQMKPYIIGCILIFGITTILNIISQVAGNLN